MTTHTQGPWEADAHEARIDALIAKHAREQRAVKMDRRRAKAPAYVRDPGLLIWALTGETTRMPISAARSTYDAAMARPDDPAATWAVLRRLTFRLVSTRLRPIGLDLSLVARDLIEDIVVYEFHLWMRQRGSIKTRRAMVAHAALAAE